MAMRLTIPCQRQRYHKKQVVVVADTRSHLVHKCWQSVPASACLSCFLHCSPLSSIANDDVAPFCARHSSTNPLLHRCMVVNRRRRYHRHHNICVALTSVYVNVQAPVAPTTRYLPHIHRPHALLAPCHQCHRMDRSIIKAATTTT